jgi:phenylpropionate dioxygenase-like ring-hydroxylating dioxygenase large terminal subunit
MAINKYQIFNQPKIMPEGWYWLIESKKLKPEGKPHLVNVLDEDLVVYRSKNGQTVCLEAYCPHMGASLADGSVTNHKIRCIFHHWEFDATGKCTDIPCLEQIPHIKIKSWQTKEQYGLVWIWLGEGNSDEDLIPGTDLVDNCFEGYFGPDMCKNFHPNALMINAIDEQHFNWLHGMRGASQGLNFEITPINEKAIKFTNTASPPKHNLIYRFINLFYKKAWTYELVYWYGHTGLVRFGPDFCHLLIMFTFRQNKNGQALGKTIYFANKKIWPFNWLIYGLSYLGDLFFGHGDNIIFRNAKFNLKHPIPQDRSILRYIEHLEKQKVVNL